MDQSEKIAELERRVRELECAPRTYPVYVPYYVPHYPYPPTQPWMAPWNPPTGPYVITCGTEATHTGMYVS